MATQAEIINKVRRRIADYEPTQQYDDNYYIEAIDNSLSKLSFDFGATYTVVGDVPFNREFLLTKLVTIDMCYVRASEGAEGGSEVETAQYTTIQVPDLSVSNNSDAESQGPGYWMKLAEDLQKEYDEEVGDKAGQNQGGYVEVGISRRISMTNGAWRKRVLDPGLDAVTLSATVDGSDVILTWSRLYAEDFLYYEIVRATDVDFETEEVLRYEPDIVETEYTDEGLAAGTYYYRVKTVNPNDISTNSNTALVTV